MPILETADRLATLESNTVGETSKGSTSIVGGWTKKVMPNGEIILTVGLDYTAGTDFNWTETSIGYLQETLPAGVFTTVSSCDCKVIDISSAMYKNAILTGISELFGNSATDKVAVLPLEHSFGDSNYGAPSKLHAVWTVR